MAHPGTSRRFYIDRADDLPVVRRVPVRTSAPAESPATHRVTQEPVPAQGAPHGQRPAWRVTALVRAGRRHSRLPRG